ncbi:HIG1 domain family member 2A, mitochondrial [Zancudomyces culisetae]|uniref:HIG1 domain family member 2A, mitochondrial n=1 Tax=Zancudomyces culisetae TaxID=1213189 RepID=A0A1R1PR47_ZANCU|nr:HIG1 domain family member 2A, mitochondrial [Zancudomyces culisetae]|eukprot:OMH83383.1 HIG1 domain family member 2A, mitochondrial [Zancudomyces culisetae]
MRETAKEKLYRKFKEEPLVLGGVGFTIAAFTYATVSLYRRNSQGMQIGMRYRILFQGLTVGALVYYSYKKISTPNVDENGNLIKRETDRTQQGLRNIDWDKLEARSKQLELELEAKMKAADKDAQVFAEEQENISPIIEATKSVFKKD